MLFISTILFLVLFLATLCGYYKSSSNGRRPKLPGLTPEFILGNLRSTSIATGRVTFHEVFTELKKEYGDAYSYSNITS